MPSPAMATTASLRLQFLDDLPLLSGQHLRPHFVDVQPARHILRRNEAVARQHDQPDAVAMQHADGFRRGLLDGIGNAEKSGGTAVNGHEHDRVCAPVQHPLL